MFQLGESWGWSTLGEQGKSWDLSELFHRQGALVFPGASLWGCR